MLIPCAPLSPALQSYRFIRRPEDDAPGTWETRLASRYYARLFREYAVADLSRYSEQKVGLRWRTEAEVAAGKGQFTCGARGCASRDGLASYELLFRYAEAGEAKSALVKVRLCRPCAAKLAHGRGGASAPRAGAGGGGGGSGGEKSSKAQRQRRRRRSDSSSGSSGSDGSGDRRSDSSRSRSRERGRSKSSGKRRRERSGDSSPGAGGGSSDRAGASSRRRSRERRARRDSESGSPRCKGRGGGGRRRRERRSCSRSRSRQREERVGRSAGTHSRGDGGTTSGVTQAGPTDAELDTWLDEVFAADR